VKFLVSDAKMQQIFLVLTGIAFLVDVYFVNCAPSKDLCTVKNGRGVVGRLGNGRDYCSYKGIPYAEPPVGGLRFQVMFIMKQNVTQHLYSLPHSFYRIQFSSTGNTTKTLQNPETFVPS
jgi:hypothetical protein